ncbi:MAG: bifunctional (p)ppGpp synthetase/guanosine-3',5'-bis(diphosphate) 3'-pyrophosphohydrolase [Candidatus Sericytochromatia bacterium]
MNELKEVGVTEQELETVKKAFALAVNLHGSQKRASGEPYYQHPIEVAEILVTLKADPEMISAGLMHDILEDTPYPPEKMKEVFGDTIYSMVDSLTKLGKFNFSSKEERQAESFRRMFMAMAKDIRVIVIKLADRLHNMRTLHHLAENKQKRIAQDTIEIFAPLANRLGMGKIKWELEDMSLRYLHPDDYWKITRHISQKREVRENYVFRVISDIEKSLKEHGIKAEISGRPKHFYSIYQKMKQQKKEFHELYDIIAMRIKVDSKADCYEALGVVHALLKPVPGRFKDYIAIPKPNLYQSLHTTVIGPEGFPLEIQIRTHEMHRIAEYGIAAHWAYKEKAVGKNIDKSSQSLQLTWLRQLIEWQNDLKDANEYLDTVKVDLYSDEVFVFTPKGDVFSLPRGATPIDFAYRIHTDVGHRCIGAKINGKIVPLNVSLSNGDQVELMLSKTKQPSLDWINFVSTSHAKNRIRQWFKKEKREENIIKGKEVLEADLIKNNMNDIPELNKKLEEIVKKLNQHTVDDMYAAIGYGELTTMQVLSRLKSDMQAYAPVVIPTANESKSIKSKSNSDILVDGIDGLLLNIATCCNPIPGEEIRGVVTRGKGMMIHGVACVNLQQVNPDRIIKVSWGAVDKNKNNSYPAEIEITSFDRIGLLKDIIAKLSDSKINILSANVITNKDKTAIINLKLEVSNLENLQKIMLMLSQISDVLNVARVQKKTVIRKKSAPSVATAKFVKKTSSKNTNKSKTTSSKSSTKKKK